MIFKFELGNEVEDTITGYKGVVVYRTEWYNGCIRYGVQHKILKDGVPVDQQHFDEEQLVLVKSKNKKAVKKTGGDRPNPVRGRDMKK